MKTRYANFIKNENPNATYLRIISSDKSLNFFCRETTLKI